jgi:hypothetical protein
LLLLSPVPFFIAIVPAIIQIDCSCIRLLVVLAQAIALSGLLFLLLLLLLRVVCLYKTCT